MPYQTKRIVRLSVATLAMALILAASAIGVKAKASAMRADEAPAQIEKEVTDLSKYVFLHQTRGIGIGVVSEALPQAVPCDAHRAQSESI